ncbi:MAG TPA: AAA family ATPase, partial [Candidatus Ozemobacteraceae bacterium]|nr:AAA family ATPase [Candidatus Ozemobacteraceae bacterium]
MLEEFGRDLSALAAVGALEPLIGRAEEVRRMIDILSMQGKNNPIIVGPPGVGKTCIVEGFAQVLNVGSVPEPLKGKKIFQLDFTAIVSGTIYRGQLEERIQRLIDELLEHREYIVFIDEFHTIALPTLNRSFDFANVLKPYLAKGEITIIGATTEEEFKKYVEEGDPALARRFVKVRVGEPPKNELKQILQRTSKRMGSRYGMVIPEVTIDRLIDLSDQYIKDRYFPDKAIDLLKEALAEKRFNMSADGMRGDLQVLENILDTEIKAVETGDLPGVEKALAAWDEKKNMIFLRTLTPDDIATMLAKRTGAVIGDNQLVETHKRIQDLDKAFGVSIIGQKRAKDAVLG